MATFKIKILSKQTFLFLIVILLLVAILTCNIILLTRRCSPHHLPNITKKPSLTYNLEPYLPSSTGGKNVLSGYFRVLQSDELKNIVEASTHKIYNVYLNYDNLYFSGTLTNFTSYYSYYDSSGNLYSNTDTIKFLINTPVTSSPNTTSFPFLGQSGVFCLPLIPIPNGATQIKFGFQITDSQNQPVLSTIDLTSLLPLTVHIFDNNKSSNSNLPLVSVSSGMNPALNIPSSNSLFSVGVIKNYILMAMDSTDSKLTTTNFSTDSSTSYNNWPYLLYMSPFPSQDTLTSTGKWFSLSPGPDATPTYYTSTTPTTPTTNPSYSSNQFLLQSVKYNNYCITGLNILPSFTPTYSINPIASGIGSSTGTTISITSNSYPVHPVGTYPEKGSKTQVAALLDPNNSSVTSLTSSTFKVTARASSTKWGALSMDRIGYAFDNIPLYGAIDAGGYNPVGFECPDLFGTHPSPQEYHRHVITPPLYNWVIDNNLRVCGYLMDGYPIVAPFLVTVDGVTRVVKTMDLNRNHGVVADISFAINGVQVRYDFFYVATFDWPYTAFAFYGTAVTIPGSGPPKGMGSRTPAPLGTSGPRYLPGNPSSLPQQQQGVTVSPSPSIRTVSMGTGGGNRRR